MLRIPGGQVVNDFEGNPVEVTEDFLLSDREISVGLFQQFMDDPAYPAAQKPIDWKSGDTNISPTADHPVQQVRWYDAVLFCNWLSHRDRLSPCYERAGKKIRDYQGNETEYDAWRLDATANGYRLPTAAEWEYACRAGTTTQFSFGDDWRWLDGYGVSRAERAEARGTKLPNGWGLFDVHGNVKEWCNDAEGSDRVNRGGYWYGPARFCGSSFRRGNHPSFRKKQTRFRRSVQRTAGQSC
jgi:formylglycine-generating enzyme required for sulfatase activity